MVVKEKYQKIKGKSQEIITNMEDRSRDFIMGFIDLFGRESVMVSICYVPRRDQSSKGLVRTQFSEKLKFLSP